MWWRRLRYVLLLIALCAIATCPAAKRSCQAKQRAREAEDLLDYLVERVAQHVAATGRVPATPAGPTPLPDCCEQGGVCEAAANAVRWQVPGWQALQFTIDDDHRFTYEYVPDASGRAAVVRAVGDLDCDDATSLYEVKLEVVPPTQGCLPAARLGEAEPCGATLKKKWTRKNPYE